LLLCNKRKVMKNSEGAEREIEFSPN